MLMGNPECPEGRDARPPPAYWGSPGRGRNPLREKSVGAGRRVAIPTVRAAPFPLPLRPALPARVPPVAPYARGPRPSVAPAAPAAAVGGWHGLV